MNTSLEQPTPRIVEVFLQPGDFYFGDRDTRIRTLLGSCISIVMWHRGLLIGGMCHFLLPSSSKADSGRLDGRYADDAIQLLLQEVKASGTRPSEYEVKLFGGGNMFPSYVRRGSRGIGATATDKNLIRHQHYSKKLNTSMVPACTTCRPQMCGVGCLNSAAARALILRHGLRLVAEHIGGDGHRQVVFDIATGDTWVRQTPVQDVIKSDRTIRK